MARSPSKVTWTDHAEQRAAQIGWSHADVERVLLGAFPARKRNRGAAGWRVEAGRTVFVFEWPDDVDLSAIRLVTLWNRR